MRKSDSSSLKEGCPVIKVGQGVVPFQFTTEVAILPAPPNVLEKDLGSPKSCSHHRPYQSPLDLFEEKELALIND